jgi:hypothetical protein
MIKYTIANIIKMVLTVVVIILDAIIDLSGIARQYCITANTATFATLVYNKPLVFKQVAETQEPVVDEQRPIGFLRGE